MRSSFRATCRLIQKTEGAFKECENRFYMFREAGGHGGHGVGFGGAGLRHHEHSGADVAQQGRLGSHKALRLRGASSFHGFYNGDSSFTHLNHVKRLE